MCYEKQDLLLDMWLQHHHTKNLHIVVKEEANPQVRIIAKYGCCITDAVQKIKFKESIIERTLGITRRNLRLHT